MKVVKIPLTDLHVPEKNVRIHSSKQIEEFKRSIQMFGQIRPIVCDENHIIIAGNGLYAALTALGKTEADCYVVEGLSAIEKKKLMLADNRIFNLGVDDLKAFDEIILELDNDFDIPGYDADLLQTLTISVDDADDYLSGYGIISDESKAQMQSAAEKYQTEDTEFGQQYEEYKPSASLHPQESGSNELQAENDIGVSEEEKPLEQPQIPLQRRFVVCPKCGEKVWL